MTSCECVNCQRVIAISGFFKCSYRFGKCFTVGEILYKRDNIRVLLIVDGNTWPRIKIRFQLTGRHNCYYFVR